MGIRFYNVCTPGTRDRSVSDFIEISCSRSERSLTTGFQRSHGRNHRGVITSRHRGGGHKRAYRRIDYLRGKVGVAARVATIEYDPNRSARIALLRYSDGQKGYILYPRGVKVGASLLSDWEAPLSTGNALPVCSMPVGTEIHNVELSPGSGGQLARAAGAVAQIVAKEGDLVTIRLPSGEVRLIPNQCWATVGQVGNEESTNLTIGKAGRRRWLGQRPRVRGVVMNPVDHPHGGGEGRAPIGRSQPVTPWGRPALGQRTRKAKKRSSGFVLKRRK